MTRECGTQSPIMLRSKRRIDITQLVSKLVDAQTWNAERSSEYTLRITRLIATETVAWNHFFPVLEWIKVLKQPLHLITQPRDSRGAAPEFVPRWWTLWNYFPLASWAYNTQQDHKTWFKWHKCVAPSRRGQAKGAAMGAHLLIKGRGPIIVNDC